VSEQTFWRAAGALLAVLAVVVVGSFVWALA
jgi:hypothetical protein